MGALHLVVTAAGAGSRFAECGIDRPKPVIPLNGLPFFQWATESVRSRAPAASLTFVVLAQHRLRAEIHAVYPTAGIVELPAVTAGAAETARLGIETVMDDDRTPAGFLDCDLAFDAPTLPETLRSLASGGLDGALCVFPSQNPNYSYVMLDDGGGVIGTVEKKVVGPWAIAGLYLFANAKTFRRAYDDYRLKCPYRELYMSGVYGVMAETGGRIGLVPVERYVSFGTPEEYEAAGTSPYLRR